MAAPNIGVIATITGKNYSCAVATSRTDLVPAVATGHVVKVNSLSVANVDGVNAADVTIELYDFSTTTYFKLANTVSVPGDATFAPKDIFPIYLEESDKITVLASAVSDLEAVASGEDMS
jgi:hypothetical protein